MECLVEKELVNEIGVCNFSIQQREELLTFAKKQGQIRVSEGHFFRKSNQGVMNTLKHIAAQEIESFEARSRIWDLGYLSTLHTKETFASSHSL